MSDVENAYKQIASFLNNETEKTLLICGIADEEKHRTLLKALNARGRSKGLIFLIHTTKDGMENFFRWAGLYKVKVPKKYGQSMQLSNLTIYFDNLSTKSSNTLCQIARAHGKSTAQVMLRWNLQRGVAVIPGSSHPDHIRDNIAIFDFELLTEEMEWIAALEKHEKHDWY